MEIASLASLGLAYVIDMLIGDPPNRWHPVAAMGSVIRWAAAHAPASRCNHRFVYGIILTLFGAAIFALPVVWLASLHFPIPWIVVLIQGLLLKAVFSLRGLLRSGNEVEQALRAGDLIEARRLVGWHLVSRETNGLSSGQVASAAIESLAENLGDSIMAPWLAFAVGGAPLAWAYRFVNTADAMIGYHDPAHEYLGKFAAKLDDVLNLIPSRLAGLLLVVSAPIVRGSLRNAWRTMLAFHDCTSSPNAGWPMSAAAGALGIVLEKTDCYRLEGGGREPAAEDISRACRLVNAAAAIGLILMLLAGAILIAL